MGWRRHGTFSAEQSLSTCTSASTDGVKATSTVWRATQLPRRKCHTVSLASLQAALAKVGFSCQNTGASSCLRHLGACRVFSLDPQPSEEQPREAGSTQSHHTRVVNGLTVWETCYLELLCWVQPDSEVGKLLLRSSIKWS